MSLPVVEAAIDDLRRAHRELLWVVDSLAGDDWQRGVPYGEWTVKDLVAHVIGDMSPSGPGLILAGVLTPEFIADTAKAFDVRRRNQSVVEERRRFTREDLRQLLFKAHDAMIAAAMRLEEKHLPVLEYTVPMGPGYELKVEDWLWHGYHDRQHADDIRRALAIDWTPQPLTYIPELEDSVRLLVRTHEGFLRAAYSVAEDAWREEARDNPGWTYHDILAHVASNEQRIGMRILSATGGAPLSDLDAINNVEEWNRQAVEARQELSFRELIDELAAGRHAVLKALSGVTPQQLESNVALAGGAEMPLPRFLELAAAHSAHHAAQLVPASRARRWSR
jgi:uncharacterized damage-inducible protein DinB